MGGMLFQMKAKKVRGSESNDSTPQRGEERSDPLTRTLDVLEHLVTLLEWWAETEESQRGGVQATD